MDIKQYQSISKEGWNAAVIERGGSFLQSYEWGIFQEAVGRKALRFRHGTFFGQVFAHPLPLGWHYLYIPRGPIGEWVELEFDDWLREFRLVTRAHHAMFLRIDPPQNTYAEILLRNNFKDTGRSIQPRQNLIVDLTRDKETLLASMHEKTRYNIRLALKRGVEIQNPTCPSEAGRRRESEIRNNTEIQNSNFEIFWSLLRETEGRQGIKLHPRVYYERMLENILPLPNTSSQFPVRQLYQRLYFASYQEKPLAVALVVYFGNRAIYLHGGSTSERKNVMAPYALHWKIIQDAKAMGFAEYDMGGVDEKRWPGLTRFKKGFGGHGEDFLNSHEVSFSSIRYRFYRFIRTFL